MKKEFHHSIAGITGIISVYNIHVLQRHEGMLRVITSAVGETFDYAQKSNNQKLLFRVRLLPRNIK